MHLEKLGSYICVVVRTEPGHSIKFTYHLLLHKDNLILAILAFCPERKVRQDVRLGCLDGLGDFLDGSQELSYHQPRPGYDNKRIWRNKSINSLRMLTHLINLVRFRIEDSREIDLL